MDSMDKMDSMDRMTVLHRLGYLVPVRKCNLKDVERDLTVVPKVDSRFPAKDDSAFRVFSRTKTGAHVVLPRYYGLAKYGEPDLVTMGVGGEDEVDVRFTGSLREYQTTIVEQALQQFCVDANHVRETRTWFGGGVISIPPGMGKTVIAINLLCRLGLKTLIVVHKNFLVEQWRDRLHQYSTAKVGMIQQNTIDIQGKDVVIAMLQSISMKEYDPELLAGFKLVVFDEVHHTSARVFSRALQRIPAPYTLGLSATPERKDGMERIFHHYLGGMIVRQRPATTHKVQIALYLYSVKHPKFREIINRYTKTAQAQTMITNLTEIAARTQAVLDLVRAAVADEPRRKVLVLTGRVGHAQDMAAAMAKDATTGLYIGGLGKQQLKHSEEQQVIFGTYDMAQEALDIQDLDTMVFASPMKGDLVQTVGRILRKPQHSYEYPPLIVDFVDNLNPFYYQARKRAQLYVDRAYDAKYYGLDQGGQWRQREAFFKLQQSAGKGNGSSTGLALVSDSD